LVDLRNIPEELGQTIINNYTAQKNIRDKTQLLNYFIAHKMKNLMEHITEF
jgi:hypothetical protein